MRNRSGVLDGTHFDSGGSQGANGRLAARSGTADANVDAAQPVVASHVRGVHRGLLGGKRSALAGSAEAQRARTLPREDIAARIRDRDDGVVERGVDGHEPMRDVLTLFLLELLGLALFLGAGSGACLCFSHFAKSNPKSEVSETFPHLRYLADVVIKLCLGARLLLVGDGALARSFAGTRVGVRALSANRQAAAMTEAAVRADFDQPLDVHRNVFAKIAFDAALVFNHLADAVNLFFTEVLAGLERVNVRGVQDLARARLPDTINVSQGNPSLLVARQIHACNTCHIPLLPGAGH